MRLRDILGCANVCSKALVLRGSVIVHISLALHILSLLVRTFQKVDLMPATALLPHPGWPSGCTTAASFVEAHCQVNDKADLGSSARK